MPEIQISTELLEAAFFKYRTYNRTFKLRDSEISWLFISPISSDEVKSKRGKIFISDAGEVNYNIEYIATNLVLTVKGEEYKLLSYLFKTGYFPEAFELLDSRGQKLHFEEV